MSETLIYIFTFLIYALILVLLGYTAFKQTHTLSDFILGNRTLGRWVSALSAGASDMSGWLLLGLPGYAYLSGLEAIWIAWGLFIGASLNWILIAPKLRHQTELSNNALTIPEFLEYYFKDNTHSLRLISALFILLFYLFYTSAGLVAAGKLFESVFDIPYDYAVVLGAFLILIYTTIGGFLAVSWTDLFQALLIFFALLLVVFLAQHSINSIDEKATSNLFNPFTDRYGEPLSIISIISLLSWGLGYFGQPHILSRFMAIKSVTQIPAARNIAITWTGVCLICAVLIGLFGVILLETVLTESTSETVLLELLPLLLPPVLAGIVLAAILAAIMSTADSQLLVSASVFTEDIVKIFSNKNISDKQLILFGRITVITIAAIACYLALDPENTVLDLVAYAWAGFGATFGPLLILIFYAKNISFSGAITGIFAGGLTVVVWKQLSGGIFDVYELLPAFIISLTSILLVSKISKSTNQS